MEAIALFWNRPRKLIIRRVIFQVHLWLGLILGTFVAIVSLSGSAVVFRNEVNRLTVPGTGYVHPMEQRLPLDDALASVLKNRPSDTLVNISMEDGPDNAWNVRTKSKEGHRIHNFVDPYRAVVVGVDDYNSKFMQWLWDLHANLLAGKAGRFVNGCLALSTLLLSLTGIILWWPGVTLLRRGLSYSFKQGWKRQNYDLHRLIGFYSFALLAIVSLTGAFFAFPNAYVYTVGKMGRVAHLSTPDLCGDDGPPAKTLWKDRGVSYEDYIRLAEGQLPGYTVKFIAFPVKPGMSVGVKLKGPNDWHRIGLSNVYLEPATGKIIAVDGFAQNNLSTKFLKLMLPFHFGRFGGRLGMGLFGVYAVMVLYVCVGVALAVLAMTGILMYWNRFLSPWRRRHFDLNRKDNSRLKLRNQGT